MWKYVLIILFLVFAIREINLMNNSIQLSPDHKKIIVDDETLTTKLIALAKQKISHPKDQQNIAKEYKIKKPSLSEAMDEKNDQNNQNQDIEKIIKTTEQNSSISDQITQSIIKEEQNKTALSEKSPPPLKPTKSLKQIEPANIKSLNLEKLEREEIKKSPKIPNDLPPSFQDAQEKVEAILREMKK